VRLTLTTSVLIVAACVVLSMVLVRQHLADLRSDLVDRGQAISDFVAREAELGVLSGDVAALRKLGTVARTYPGVAYCRFFDRDGSLLASVGDDAPAPPTPVLTEPSSDAAPVAAGPDVSEFREAITTTLLRPHREELLDDEAGATEPPATRRRIGAVTIGLELGQLHAQRRLAFMTAVAFTLLVALLAAASAALLLHGTLRTVARAAELSQERSRLAELKASFVTQASHEFRTPLAVILACCTVLQDYGTRLAPEQRQRRLAKIRASVQHMTELLEDVLLLGRAESGKLARAPKPIDLEALCQEVVTDVQSTASDAHRLVLSCSGCEGETMVDPKLVRLVLRNLLANAVKYSPEGGTVRLDVARREGWVDLRVADQGIGIAKEDAPTLFEPFRRGVNVGAIPGSGLGLAITQKAVASLDGSITVESRPGRGTTFTVRVPVDSPTTSAHAAGPPVAEPLRASCCPEAGRSGR
jgi:signal transduction histidine kinase